MLNRGMLISLGVAAVLALPPTLYFIRGWVASFAYKAPVPWWLYPAAVLLVLAIAAATVSIQSWKAATANPVNSLKSE
jgi:putative ABC transport system permease protein